MINLVAIFGHVLFFSNWKIFSRWRLRWRNKVCLIFSPPPPPFNFKTPMLSHRETNPFRAEIFLAQTTKKNSSLFVGVWRGEGSGLEGWCKKRLQEGKREVINYLCRLSTLTLKSSFLAFWEQFFWSTHQSYFKICLMFSHVSDFKLDPVGSTVRYEMMKLFTGSV